MSESLLQSCLWSQSGRGVAARGAEASTSIKSNVGLLFALPARAEFIVIIMR